MPVARDGGSRHTARERRPSPRWRPGRSRARRCRAPPLACLSRRATRFARGVGPRGDGRRRDRARLVERTGGDFGCSRGRDDAGAVVLARVRRLGRSRARELRDAARSRLDAARAAPRAPRGGALARARQPRVASRTPRRATVKSRGVDLNPANHARRAAVAARAPAFRHRTPIAVVFGGAATIATWHSSLYAIDFFARGAPGRSRRRTRDARLSITFVTLGSRSLRRRAFADPDVVHAAIVRRVENHAGLREVLDARVASAVGASPRRRAAWIWRRRGRLLASLARAQNPPRVPTRGHEKNRDGDCGGETVRTGYAYKTIVVDVADERRGANTRRGRGGRARSRRRRIEAIGPSLRAPLEAMLSEAYERERAREEEEEAAAARPRGGGRAEASRPGSLDRGGGMTSAERAWDYVADVAHASRRAAARARDVARGMWASRRRA